MMSFFSSSVLIYKQFFRALGSLKGETLHHGAMLAVLLLGVPFFGLSQAIFRIQDSGLQCFCAVRTSCLPSPGFQRPYFR